MNDYLKIVEIQKSKEKINDDIVLSIQKTKLLALFGLLIVASKRGVFDVDTRELILSIGIVGETLSVTSLVKTLCSIYQNKDKTKRLENELKQK